MIKTMTKSEAAAAEARFQDGLAKFEADRLKSGGPEMTYDMHKAIFVRAYGAEEVRVVYDPAPAEASR